MDVKRQDHCHQTWREFQEWRPALDAGRLGVCGLCLPARPVAVEKRYGHPSVGTPVTELVLEPLTGADSPLNSRDLEGQIVLLNFWGTWCGPCRVEFPHIVQIGRRFAGQDDFRLVSVSVPYGQEDAYSLAEQTQSFLNQQGAEFGTYADLGGGTLERVMAATGISSAGIPLTIVLDRQARIRGVWQGFQPGDEVAMAQLVSELL